MSKDDAISIMNNFSLNEETGSLSIFFSLHLKINETTYYERNRDVILNRAKYYYEYNKGLLREKAKNKYRELSEEEKNIRREYGRNRYHNMSKEKKQRLKEYQRNYREAKNQHKALLSSNDESNN